MKNTNTENKKYFVKPHFSDWREVSEDNFNEFIDNILQHANAMNEQQKQEKINQITFILTDDVDEIWSDIFSIIDDNTDFKSGFSIYDNDIVELQQYTPADEDWYLEFNSNDPLEFIDEIIAYSENFDIDEDVEAWIPYRGQNGVPETIEQLLENAEYKKEELETLAEKLKDYKEKYDIVYNLVNKEELTK